MQAAVETVHHPPLFRRHARRPRLTRLLDESRAQAIVITAPAGYGKTTLATEWLQGREDVFWYHATNASADVAAFSAGLADLVSALLPGAGDRLKQRLRVADTPERAARPLAELLAEDLAEWPESALLVVDDYHLVADSAPVEDFFDWLLTLAPQLRVLVTSRRRPRWASARRILYAEITEIGRDQLAMNAEEAGRALGDDRSSESVRALVTQAEGWPALIGLAALTASREIPGERVSEALYRYFAEEVVRREAPEVERFMLLASVPATVDARIAREVLGIEDPRTDPGRSG
jgi:LuxR family maltose regulon positive regulatory protein